MLEFFAYNNVASDNVSTIGFVGLGPQTSSAKSFVSGLQAAGGVTTNTVTPVFSPSTNLTEFLYGGSPANIYFGVVKGETEGINGKNGPSHKIDPSDGSKGWNFKLADYKFNNAKVALATATDIRLSTQPFLLFPTIDLMSIYATVATSLTATQLACLTDETSSTCGASGMACSAFYDNFPGFEFTIDSTKYTLPPQAFLYDTGMWDESTNSFYNACVPMVSSDMTDTTTISAGLPFVSNFVPTLDYDNNAVSFGLNSASSDVVKLKSGMNGLDITLIIIGSVVGVGILGFVAFKCMKK